MKKAELKELIKSRIRETLYAGMGALAKAKSDPDYSKVKDKASIDTTLKAGGSVELEEMELDEARALTVSDDFREKAQSIKTGGPINPSRLNAVLDFLEGKTVVTGPQIATAVGFDKQLPRVYPIIAALLSVDALASPVASQPTRMPDEDEATYKFREEEPEEEPDTVEKATVSMDPDTQTASTFTVENAELISSIIRNYKDSRARVNMNEADDLDSKRFQQAAAKSKESSAERLDRKINELAAKIAEFSPEVQTKILEILDFKFKSVDATGLTKMIAKKVGLDNIPTSNIDVDIEDISDDITEDVEDIDAGSEFKDYENVYERMNHLVNYKG